MVMSNSILSPPKRRVRLTVSGSDCTGSAFIVHLSCAGAPTGRPRGRVTRGRLLARVARHLLQLLHDLVEVVASRILHRRERLVGFELREPQCLADGQQVPVVDVGRGRPGERAAEPEIRLFLLAPPHLEWIALEVRRNG